MARTGKNAKRREAQPARGARRAAWPAGWPGSLVLVVLFMLAALLQVRARLVVVQLGYQLSEATREHKRLLAQNRKLQVEVATLRSPRRLRKLALEQLGLREPVPAQIVRGGARAARKLAMGER